jgi:hypothetical protein
MTPPEHSLSRREFLKVAGLGLGMLTLRPWNSHLLTFEDHGLALPDFPKADLLGRNCSGGKISLWSRPDISSSPVKDIYEDTVLPWLREVYSDNPDNNVINQRWVETPDGYVYGANFQPCRNLPNPPLTAIPNGQAGFWAEVSVPYVDLSLDNPPARSPGLRKTIELGQTPRLYYSQVMWIDQVMTNSSGAILYRINEDAKHGYGYGDIYWAEGAGFRPLTADDVAPIHPDVDPATKKIVISVTYQTLSCLEGDKEVYFCRVSTGSGAGATPVGENFAIWRKALTIHMSGGNLESGYDGPGISWTSFFQGEGVAIHAATWHNDFGNARSHGCVNCAPEDAKWVFRWTQPDVDLATSDLTWQNWQTGSTHVNVEQRYF